jgi:HK97 family phage major capsid protein
MGERFKTAAELLAEKCELLDRAEALSQLIEDENREFTADEKAEFDSITGEQLTAKDEEHKARVAYEAKRNALRDARAQANSQTPSWAGGPLKEQADAPRVELKGQKSKHFADPRDAYLAGQWFKARMFNDAAAVSEMNRLGWAEYASQGIGQGSTGGYLVPQPIVTEIIKNRDNVGIAAQVANIVQMTSDTLTLPEETTRPTVYYPAESVAITASEGALKTHKLVVSKRAAVVYVTRELMADAAISAADWVVDQLSYEFAYAMDNELLNGNGTSTFGGEVGLISAMGTAGRIESNANEDLVSELDLDEWERTVAKLPGKFHNYGPKWIMNRATFFGSCLVLGNAAGGNTISMLQGGLTGLQWMGYPVVLSDLMPTPAASTTAALFGAFDRAVTIGDRGDMRLETDASVRFLNDEVAIKMTHRYDILVHNPGDATNAGAYVALRTVAA